MPCINACSDEVPATVPLSRSARLHREIRSFIHVPSDALRGAAFRACEHSLGCDGKGAHELAFRSAVFAWLCDLLEGGRQEVARRRCMARCCFAEVMEKRDAVACRANAVGSG